MAVVIENLLFVFGIPARVPGIVGLDVTASPHSWLTVTGTFMVEDGGEDWLLHLTFQHDKGVSVNDAVDPIRIPKNALQK